MTLPDTPWYCLRARPKHEAIAAVSLRRLDPPVAEVFCPRVRFQRARRPRAGYGADPGWSWATEAMFPGYLFARFDLTAQSREVQHAHGVMKIVTFGNRPQIVPPGIMSALCTGVAEMGDFRTGEDSDPSLATITVAPAPEPGREIVLLGGALGGLRAVVTHYLPARQRVRVLLEFLGREMETELAASRVMAPFSHPLLRG